MSESETKNAPKTLSDDDVKVERKQVVRTAQSIGGSAIRGAGGAPRPDDPDRRGGPPATDHDS